VRAAIGADFRHHARQVLTEGLLLSLLACIAGVLIAWAATTFIRRMDPTAQSFGAIAINPRVVLGAVVAALIAPLGFALLPAIRSSKVTVSALSQGSAGAGEHRSAQRLRHLLVVVQMAIAVVLLVQIGAFARTAWTFMTLEKGFDDTNLLTFSLELTRARYADAASLNRFVGALLLRLETVPGVISAAAINRLPIAERELSARMRIEGTSLRPEEQPTVTLAKISEQFLNTLKIPVVRGRAIEATDVASRHSVALLSQAAASRYWPGADPIGARITLDGDNPAPEWLEIVGIVGNVRNSQADQGPAAQVYVPLSLSPDNMLSFAILTSDADPASLAPAIRTAVATLDNEHPVFAMKTMRQVVFDDLQGTILLVSVLVGIALIALSPAAAGIYGLASFTVTRRTREIAVRMALGSPPLAVLRLVVSQSARPVLVGALFGTAAAIAMASVASEAISDVNFRDPVTYAGVVIALVAIAMVASIIPARRATTVNPVDALRAE
jgi:predicted permease